jgi:hypothetical protein
VLVAVTWWDGDRQRSDAAVYDVLWRTQGRMLGGRKLTLMGFTLRARTASAKALDAAWAKVKPAG